MDTNLDRKLSIFGHLSMLMVWILVLFFGAGRRDKFIAFVGVIVWTLSLLNQPLPDGWCEKHMKSAQ